MTTPDESLIMRPINISDRGTMLWLRPTRGPLLEWNATCCELLQQDSREKIDKDLIFDPLSGLQKTISCLLLLLTVKFTHDYDGPSTEFCRGWYDGGSSKDIATATSTSSNTNSTCVQLVGDIRNALDQQHFCVGDNITRLFRTTKW